MAFHRESFPDSTVTPKLHFLEEHTIPWLKKYQVGCGLRLRYRDFPGQMAGEN